MTMDARMHALSSISFSYGKGPNEHRIVDSTMVYSTYSSTC